MWNRTDLLKIGEREREKGRFEFHSDKTRES